MSRSAFDHINNTLNLHYYKGNRHNCRRDVGRLVGGYLASGSLPGSDFDKIRAAIAAGSDTPKHAVDEFDKAVAFGQKEPVAWEENSWSFDDDGQDGGFGWDDPLPGKTLKAIPRPEWVQPEELPEPADDWAPMDFARYLEVMFQAEERVGVCVDTWKKDEAGSRWLPKKGVWDRTAGQLIELVHSCKGDLGAVLGDPNEEAGAWIRINPLDGDGCRDENVTAFRHALLESDEGDLGQQLAIILEMQLPCSAIVHSGKKSIHALVRVEAESMHEYRSRVDYLYKIAEKYGLKVDGGNRNPSRLSRLPGVMRSGKPQYMISGPCGLADWQTWVDHVEDLKDDLPDPERLSETFDNLPDLAPALIDGILRVGHKLAVTGPSKAGKSFALIELAGAIAEGREWMGMQCKQGPVLYINLELDRVSCLHRFHDVFHAHGWEPKHIDQVDIWNLRGKSVPLDHLVPKLIRRAHHRGYVAVIIDPIYKVLTGDENNAEDMAKFCNQFDRIALSLSCAVIYVHHHSKGDQGGKRAIDRASGSGVFGRDPDAVLDLIELMIDKDRRTTIEKKVCCDALDRFIAGIDTDNKVGMDDRTVVDAYLLAAQGIYKQHSDKIISAVSDGYVRARNMTGWRIDATLREFAPAESKRIWFDWPIHSSDDSWKLLKDAKAAGEEPPWMAQQNAKKAAQKDKTAIYKAETQKAIDAHGGIGNATVKNVAEELKISYQAALTRVKKYSKATVIRGLISENEDC